jgi:hypothetical protein
MEATTIYSVTLAYAKIGDFIGWGDNQLRKKGLSGIINKLEDMGCTNIIINGKGKKAVYTFDVSEDLFMMMMVNATYSPMNVDIMKSLVKGNITMVGTEPFHLFGTEIAAEIAKKHHVELDTVKKAMTRMRTHLQEHGMMMDHSNATKSHRIMNCHKEWIKGARAIVINNEIKRWWRLMYEGIDAAKANGEKISLREVSLRKRQNVDFIYRHYSAESYRVARHVQVSQEVLDVITWAKRSFMDGTDLGAIRKEIAARKAAYKVEYDAEKEMERAEKANRQAKFVEEFFAQWDDDDLDIA